MVLYKLYNHVQYLYIYISIIYIYILLIASISTLKHVSKNMLYMTHNISSSLGNYPSRKSIQAFAWRSCIRMTILRRGVLFWKVIVVTLPSNTPCKIPSNILYPASST